MILVTAHGRVKLRWTDAETVLDCLQKHGIPWSSGSLYVEKPTGFRLYPALKSKIADLMTKFESIEFILQRNIDPLIFLKNSSDEFEQESPTSQFFYQQITSQCISKPVLRDLSSKDCLKIVKSNIKDSVDQIALSSRCLKLVVGVSGGGDSNALLAGLADCKTKIIPLIIKGFPEWDLGVPRAIKLAEKYNLNLEIVEQEQVFSALGMVRQPGEPLLNRFERYFEKDDFEMLASLIISRVLAKKSQELGADYFVIGGNLEDIGSEALSRILKGELPRSLPTRNLGDATCFYPLWLTPKTIIDGCFPKFSLENYQSRYPSIAPGRNIAYNLAYSIQSTMPSALERIARFAANHGTTSLKYDEDLGFHVDLGLKNSTKNRLLKMFRNEKI